MWDEEVFAQCRGDAVHDQVLDRRRWASSRRDFVQWCTEFFQGPFFSAGSRSRRRRPPAVFSGLQFRCLPVLCERSRIGCLAHAAALRGGAQKTQAHMFIMFMHFRVETKGGSWSGTIAPRRPPLAHRAVVRHPTPVFGPAFRLIRLIHVKHNTMTPRPGTIPARCWPNQAQSRPSVRAQSTSARTSPISGNFGRRMQV